MKPRTKTNWRPKLETLEARRLLSVYADFNGDGFEDLAIGVHGENNLAGAVSVIYGGVTGLSASGKFHPPDQFWSQDSPNVGDASEAGDQFGRVLAAGDFNNDGYSDLAIGVPFEDGTVADIGMVQVLHGTAAGLTATGSQVWQQGLLGRTNEFNDRFGGALAVGDFNGDEFDDLAVGRPGEAFGSIGGNDETGGSTPLVGGADVIYGSMSGLTALGNQEVYCSPGGVFDEKDQYGGALAAGDFDGDGFDDLAIGISGHDDGIGRDEHGAVQILYSDFDGFLCDFSFINQDTDGIAGETEDFDRFGFSLATGDFNSDGAADLAIGVPFEDVGDLLDAGAAYVLYGQVGQGIQIANNQFWSQSALAGGVETGDLFGVSLVAGDLNPVGLSPLES